MATKVAAAMAKSLAAEAPEAAASRPRRTATTRSAAAARRSPPSGSARAAARSPPTAAAARATRTRRPAACARRPRGWATSGSASRTRRTTRTKPPTMFDRPWPRNSRLASMCWPERAATALAIEIDWPRATIVSAKAMPTRSGSRRQVERRPAEARPDRRDRARRRRPACAAAPGHQRSIGVREHGARRPGASSMCGERGSQAPQQQRRDDREHADQRARSGRHSARVRRTAARQQRPRRCAAGGGRPSRSGSACTAISAAAPPMKPRSAAGEMKLASAPRRSAPISHCIGRPARVTRERELDVGGRADRGERRQRREQRQRVRVGRPGDDVPARAEQRRDDARHDRRCTGRTPAAGRRASRTRCPAAGRAARRAGRRRRRRASVVRSTVRTHGPNSRDAISIMGRDCAARAKALRRAPSRFARSRPRMRRGTSRANCFVSGFLKRAVLVEQVAGAADVGLGLRQRRHVEEDQRLAQVVVGAEAADRARRADHHRRGLAAPRALPVRTRADVDRVLQHAGHRAVVFRGDEQHRVGLGDLLP